MKQGLLFMTQRFSTWTSALQWGGCPLTCCLVFHWVAGLYGEGFVVTDFSCQHQNGSNNLSQQREQPSVLIRVHLIKSSWDDVD